MGTPRTQIRWNGWGWTAHQENLGDDVWRWLAGELGMPALLATPPRPLESITLPASLLSADILAAFCEMLGQGQVRQEDHERAFHARGRSYQDLLHLRAGDLSCAPDAVLYPRGEDEVLAVLKYAAAHSISVIPFGGGTSQVGGAGALPGRVTIDLSDMDRVIAIDTLAGTATFEAGICGAALDRALSARDMAIADKAGLFEFASLGGRIAGQASGDANWLCGARMATAHGMLSFDNPETGALKALMLGSEGILGVITQATVRIRPLRPITWRRYRLRDFVSGVAVMRAAQAQDIPLLALYDAGAARFACALAPPQHGLKPLLTRLQLFLRGFETGSCVLVAGLRSEASARRMAAIVRSRNGMHEGAAENAMDNGAVSFYHRDLLLDHGVGVETFRALTGWAGLPSLCTQVTQALEAAMRQNAPRAGARGLVLARIDSPSADGASLSFTCIFPRLLTDEIAQAQAIRKSGLDAIRAQDGIIGAGGVGEDYLPWTLQEKGALGIAALRGVKQALDPENILNPGKLLPPEPGQA